MTTPNPSASLLERLFKLSENKTNFRTEVLAGLTTFLTMCYIIIVNPLILAETGMDYGAVFVATCLAAAIGCLVMGLIANYPIALAPGMGLNAYFTYSVCLGMGIEWQTALAAVFVSGLIFIAISMFKVREAIVNAIPMSLKLAIGGGIGLFLALVALKNAGIIVDNPATLVGLGDLKDPKVLLALFGLLLIVVMHHFKIRGAIIISILVVTGLATAMGLNEFQGVVGKIPSLAPTFMQMNFRLFAKVGIRIFLYLGMKHAPHFWIICLNVNASSRKKDMKKLCSFPFSENGLLCVQ